MTLLAKGSRAPAFRLPSDAGKMAALKDFAGHPVVLYFYPKDDTSGCTTEACGFRDSWAAVRKAGATVLGVSPDGVASHAKFRKKYTLPFPLLADEDHAVASAYGVWGRKQMYGRTYHGILRTTYIIGPTGRIAHVFPRVRPAGHAAEVLSALEELP